MHNISLSHQPKIPLALNVKPKERDVSHYLLPYKLHLMLYRGFEVNILKMVTCEEVRIKYVRSLHDFPTLYPCLI